MDVKINETFLSTFDNDFIEFIVNYLVENEEYPSPYILWKSAQDKANFISIKKASEIVLKSFNESISYFRREYPNVNIDGIFESCINSLIQKEENKRNNIEKWSK
jgi:hypothetical protein